MDLRQVRVVCVFLAAFPCLQCPAQIGQVYARSTLITGDCEADMKPSLAVITGGVAVSALKPTEAAEQLDKQLALIRSYVQQSQGSFQERERVRMVHTEGSVNGQVRDPTFQIAQKLRIEFPADAPVDRIFEHLMELGMDRFGDNMSLPENRQSIAVVHFEIPNFDAQLRQIRDHCTAEAWKDWCDSTPPKNQSCDASAPPASLQVQNFTLRSTEKLMRPDGPPDYLRSAYATYSQPQSPPELLGNVTLHLVGNITLNNPEPDKSK
jgi:hypothetical protein